MASNTFHWTGTLGVDPNIGANWEGGSVPSGSDLALVFDASSKNACEGTLLVAIDKLFIEEGFSYYVGSTTTPFTFTGSPTTVSVKAGDNNLTGSSGIITTVRMYGATTTVFNSVNITTLETGGSIRATGGSPQFTGSVTVSDTCRLTNIDTGMDSSGTIIVEPRSSVDEVVTLATVRGRGITLVCRRAVVTCELNDAPEGLTNLVQYDQTDNAGETAAVALVLTVNSPSHSRARFEHNFNQTVSSITCSGGTVSFEGHIAGDAITITTASVSNGAILNLRNNNNSITASAITVLNSDCQVIVDDDATLTVSPPTP